jgi:hypothetical protein
MNDHDLNEGDVYDITLTNGEELSGYTLYAVGTDTITVGYDGEQDDPSLEGIGLKRVIRLADVEEISPV